MFSYSFNSNQQEEIQSIPEHIKKEGNISFKMIDKLATQCVRVMRTPFGEQLSIDQGKMYRLLDNYVNMNMDIHGNYIVKVNKRDNCWVITGTKE